MTVSIATLGGRKQRKVDAEPDLGGRSALGFAAERITCGVRRRVRDAKVESAENARRDRAFECSALIEFGSAGFMEYIQFQITEAAFTRSTPLALG